MKLSGFNCLPLTVFGLVYFLTSYLGAALLLWGPDSARLLYRIYAGVDVPVLSSREFLNLLLLLHVPLLVMAASYMATVVWAGERLRRFNRAVHSPRATWVGVMWVGSFAAAAGSLWHGGAFGNAHAWVSSYESWVTARWMLFGALSIPEFINLYVILPVLSSLLVQLLWPVKRGFAGVVAMVGLVLTLLLFQKKQPIVYLLAVLLPFWIARHSRLGARSHMLRHATVALLVALVVYVALVFVPMLGLAEGPTRANQAPATAAPLPTDAQVQRADQLEQFRSRLLSMPAVAEKSLFLINSVIFRTAAPAIYYPMVFPARHPFYGLDLPLDGFTTDDNLIVWNAMWPDLPGGSVSAPYPFSIYAQVGLLGVMVFAALTGITLALAWIWSAVVQPPQPLSLLGATLTLVFTIFIAIDTLRNSVISSYGLAWGVALLLLLGWIGRHGRNASKAQVAP